eukprot:9489595-Alexandrium_andersonii.AAC.1
MVLPVGVRTGGPPDGPLLGLPPGCVAPLARLAAVASSVGGSEVLGLVAEFLGALGRARVGPVALGGSPG